MLNIQTQQNKSLPLREIFHRLQNGLPVNVHQHQTFDLSSDCDFDSQVIDEFSDKLEVQDYHIQLTESIDEQRKNYKPQNEDNNNPLKSNQNETQKNETPQD